MLAPSELVAELARHPHLAALAQRVKAVCSAAYAKKRVQLLNGEEVADLAGAELAAVSQVDAVTTSGNLLEVLDRGPQAAGEWGLLGALWAHHTASTATDEDIAEALWLSTQTPLVPLLYADRAWPSNARSRLWDAVANASLNPVCAFAERAALAATLACADSEEGRVAATRASENAIDPLAYKLLLPGALARKPLIGELTAGRGPIRTTLLALSGLLFVLGTLRVLARFVLGLRRRATVVLHADGISVSQSTVLLGKALRTTERFLPMAQISSIRRETRHAGLALYAGLFCLALGSYVGMGLISDALWAPGGSSSLVSMGLLVVAVGVLLDFLLYRLAGLRGGKARLTIAPRRGPSLVLSGPEVPQADAWVRRVSDVKGA
jgi:hypothetical protein